MAINFPDNPTSGQTYTYNGISWSWNGSAWEKAIGNNVNFLNGLTGGITLAAGSGITLTGSAKTITISTIVGVGATGPTGPQGNTGATGATGAQGEPGQSSNYYNYKVHTTTQTPPTGDGEIRYNNATQTSSTTLYVDHLDSNGDDIDVFLSLLKQNDNLIIQDANNSNNYQTWKITSAPTVILNDYTSIPVTGITSAGTGTSGFSNNHSVLFIVFSSPIATAYVESFNGLTGAVTGVNSVNGLTGALSLLASTGIGIAAGGKGITFTNTGVQSFNGLTGAVTGVTVGGANIFTALNSFNSGISSAGGTFSALTRFNAGISSAGGTFSANTVFSSGLQTDSVLSTTGVGGTLYLNSSANGDGGGSITYIGDWDGSNNGTTITVDDQSALITLNSNVSTTSISTTSITASSSVVVGAAAATIETATTTLGTTAANQTISTTTIYDADTSLDVNRTIEFLVQASTSSAYEALKIIAIHDGTNTYNTQYGLIRSGSSLCSSYTTTIATVTGGSKVLRLRATPTNTNTTFKVVRIIIPA